MYFVSWNGVPSLICSFYKHTVLSRLSESAKLVRISSLSRQGDIYYETLATTKIRHAGVELIASLEKFASRCEAATDARASGFARSCRLLISTGFATFLCFLDSAHFLWLNTCVSAVPDGVEVSDTCDFCNGTKRRNASRQPENLISCHDCGRSGRCSSRISIALIATFSARLLPEVRPRGRFDGDHRALRMAVHRVQVVHDLRNLRKR